MLPILVLSLLYSCPNISTVSNLNLTKYIESRWYIQLQQETPYLPKNSNYCVTAHYTLSNKSIPFYKGKVLNVYNDGRLNNVTGEQLNRNNTTLCARVNGENSKLLVAPCFLPNIFAGDYWIIFIGLSSNNHDYDYAIVSGGQPNKQYNSGCSTSTTSINESGLWVLTRNQTVSESFINNIKLYLVTQAITPTLLNRVQQEGCQY